MSALPPTVIEKEMSATRREFFRVAERFLEGRDFSIHDDGFVLNEAGKTLDVSIKDLPARRITALMVLPRMNVQLSFSGYSNDEVKDLVAVFDRHYQRGGG